MTRTLALAAVLALSPAHAAADGVPRDPEAWPAHVRVFRRHARGGSAPARIEVVGFRTYVARVLASGAMPADRPMAALRAMAVVVATRAAWLVRHPDPRMRWHGRRFDVTDGSRPRWCGACDHGMLYRAVRPHSRIRRAVADVLGALLVRPNGALRKPQWSSGSRGRCGAGRTGNRLPAMGSVACARRGWGWRHILATYFPKGTVGR